MRPFNYIVAADDAVAVNAASRDPASKFLAGGTTLIDLMKLNVAQPDQLVDINKLAHSDISSVNGGLLIGALTKNSDVVINAMVQQHFPILAKAILSGASPQLRNMATVGGNIMQRTRCPYFRDVTMPCNKREPGSGCPALTGHNRMHAILGGSDSCIAVHASDMCVALTALDAVLIVKSANGERKVPIEKFYLVPGNHPEQENVLNPGELIVAVELPLSKFASRSHYLKVRDRSSFSFALASVAACLSVQHGTVIDARIVLGGVATKPWRCQDSEKILIGKPVSAAAFAQAAAAAVAGAMPHKHNKFKVELAKRSVVRALEIAALGVT